MVKAIMTTEKKLSDIYKIIKTERFDTSSKLQQGSCALSLDSFSTILGQVGQIP